MAKLAVYPGSFDPCTNGHLDIIQRSSKVFDKLIVAVLSNSEKTAIFSVSERIAMLEKVIKDAPNIEIRSFEGLLVDFLEKVGADVVIKGLRAISDFEYECQMALINKNMKPDCETLFMPTSTQNSFLSSSVVKEIAKYGGDLNGLVPKEIQKDIIDKMILQSELGV